MPKFEAPLKPTRNRLLVAGVAAVLVAGAIVYDRVNDSPTVPATGHSDGEFMENHTDITATVFWVGEGATEDNDFIQNRSSVWQDDWMGHFGGVDDPEDRCGYRPCGFIPKENPFYFALPFNDRGDNGEPKPEEILSQIPWYEEGLPDDQSQVKNRWVLVSSGDKTAYAQWEDAGPFGEDDEAYVFGDARPRESRAGIDLSPATADYLGIDGRGEVSWKFVEEDQVPAGPWREIITASGIVWE